jgi:UDP-N-acetylglucosamine 4,6-dehydratase
MANNSFWEGKRVLVTGGTGTFGRAFVRKILETGVERVIVFSRDEFKQYQMRQDFTDPRVHFFIGDIRDLPRLERAFNGVDIVVHAAALKQVPAIEYNPIEAVKTNVNGTQNVIDAALNQNVERVMVISSDKAVQPINLYGATKLCAERLAVASNAYRGATGKTRVSVMRYGNVLGSRGSIVELIENQKDSGEIPLTDERMTRFWIHIEDVIGRVLKAIELMEGGETFVPNMKSSSVTSMISLLAPNCKMKVIGMRPGEKLHETLITEYEISRTKDLGDIFVILPEFQPWKSDFPFAKYPDLSPDVVYASNSPFCLVESAQDVEVLIKPKQ